MIHVYYFIFIVIKVMNQLYANNFIITINFIKKNFT